MLYKISQSLTQQKITLQLQINSYSDYIYFTIQICKI